MICVNLKLETLFNKRVFLRCLFKECQDLALAEEEEEDQMLKKNKNDI